MTKKRHHRTRNVNATQKATHNKDAASSEEDTDRLTKLPDDLLLNILERVDTLDAIRACVLSKRMMKLPTMLSHFFLSCSSIPGHHVRARVFNVSEFVRTNSVVAHVTDNILSTRSPEITISRLKIRFLLVQPDCYTIGKSVAHAMKTQKVGAAEFQIVTDKTHLKCSPADLLDHAKQLNDFLGACRDAFAGLRRLWLCNMRFGGELDIPNILSTCKLLESLRLTHCDSGMNSVLQLEHAQLTELEVDYGKFEIVELTCLPKLRRVSYKSWFYSEKDPLYFGFVPQLSKLRLAKTGSRSTRTLELSQLLGNVPSISDLHLDFESEKIWVLPESPELLRPVLSKLQHVILEKLPEGCDLAWTMFILEAAPSLKELCITVWDHWCHMVMRDKEFRERNGYCEKADVEWKPHAPDFKHKNLVKLTIYGFQPDDIFVRFIRCVREHAVNMAEISLHDRKVCLRCGDLDPKMKCPSRYPRNADERMQIIEELGMSLPGFVRFMS
ncbi:hypothetical protein CFC21_090406 [Triticum aestivum]|uniref:F-box domain-containing protein n=2 Tax=Triticum aestivum TaxID=4565 RepID=A0A3B6PVK3_WHEAT|nr:uncharacterized protein LOC123140012 [Triticum aestivum]KAF7087201.1 hypothetical protein CFC21_090406 [Triticum aestivum]